jgi:PmbA protein
MSTRLLDGYLSCAQRAGAAAEVLLVRSRRHEAVARSGIVELDGESQVSHVALRLERGGRAAFGSAPAAVDPEPVVERTLAMLEHLPPVDRLLSAAPASAALRATDLVEAGELRRFALDASRRGSEREVELRCMQELRAVEFAASSGGRGAYETAHASLLFRATAENGEGSVGHADRADFGPSLGCLAARFEERLRKPALEHARVLASATKPDVLPDTVVVEAAAAAPLVGLFAKSLLADAVAQGRSRLAGQVGSRIAARGVSIVDDPLAPNAPLAAAFDDEGSVARRRVLVDDGVLVDFLADRRFSPAVGSSPGCGWRQSPTAPPRPRASNLFLDAPTDTTRAEGPQLRLVQSYGLHMANEVTGEFSMGAAGVVAADGVERGVVGLTVAGNVFDVVARLRALRGDPHWSRAGGAYLCVPDLVVGGVTVGI